MLTWAWLVKILQTTGFKTNQWQNSKTKFGTITFLTYNFLNLFVFTKGKQERVREEGIRVGVCAWFGSDTWKKKRKRLIRFYQWVYLPIALAGISHSRKVYTDYYILKKLYI